MNAKPETFMADAIKSDYAYFNDYFNDLYIPLCRYCFKFVGSEQVAEDIVQQQFVTLWEKRNDLSLKSSPAGYLFKAVKNRSIDYLRHLQRLNAKSLLYEISNAEVNNNPEEIFLSHEKNQILHEAIESLPEKSRLVMQLKRKNELTNTEIADCLGISVKTLENQITQSIKKIRVYFENFYSLKQKKLIF